MRKRLIALVALAAATFGLLPAHAAPTVIRSFITSFDDTPIVYNLFLPDPADTPAPWPVVLNGHGWGGSGSQSAGGFIGTLLSEGYAVLTWDARGFGQSGGEAWVDDPAREGRDVSALIDLLAARSDIANVGGDPLVGMIGGSYAGGIQLATSAFDPRVDAIVPNVTWNDLRYSLFPNGVVKLGFDTGLYATGLAGALGGGLSADATAGPQAGSYSADLNLIEAKGVALGYADPGTLSWFRERSVAGYGVENPVAVPTLILQGITDALFNVNEAVANFDHVAAQGAPVKLMVFCGGHVACPSNYNAGVAGYTNAATMKWLDRYVKGIESVDTGAPVEYATNDGVWHQAAVGFDKIATSWTTVNGRGTLVSSGAKTSVINGMAGVTYATPSHPLDPGTLTIPTAITGGSTIVGIPKITLRVGGAGPGAHLFVKLIDRDENLVDPRPDQVVDLQEAAMRVELIDPLFPQTIRFDGVGVSYVVPAGHRILVQVSTSSGAMSEYRGAAIVDLDATIRIPML